MRVVGLTGGIACGKSLVSSWLAQQPECRVIDGDRLSRELTAPGGPALPAILEQFGSGVFLDDHTLNRRALGKRVFASPAERDRLDRLMAPLLRDLTLSRIQEARDAGFSLCFLDFPLLFEKGYDTLCDAVWCVVLPRPLQLRRLMLRDSLSEEEALQRMDAVFSTEEKASRSQVIIDNSGDRAFTLSTLPPLLAAELEKAQARSPRRRRSPEDGNPVSVSSLQETLPSPRRTVSPRAGNSPEMGGTMERPSSARRGEKPKVVPWKMPRWLIALLSAALFLVLAAVTAEALMRAYLTRQEELHRSEAQAILTNYPLEYRQMIEEASGVYNLNPAFVAAIIRNESSFQPRAESSVGARGLMQLMPETAQWIAGKLKVAGYSFDRMYDPESNIRFGCWYLNYLSGLFRGDPVCVACAYHAGQGQVTAWLSDSRYSDDGVSLQLSRLLEGPTKSYAGKVIRTYGIYQALYFDDGRVAADPSASLDGGDRR